MTESLPEGRFNNRVLICDDNQSIHEDLIKIFRPPPKTGNSEIINHLESLLFEDPSEVATAERIQLDFQLESAFSGREAIRMVKKAKEEGNPYSLIFMDVRMPPGPDGILTSKEIWEALPTTEIVILTAYSDYSWDGIIHNLGSNDKLLYLRKPFSSIAVKQIALNLVNRWNMGNALRERIEELEAQIES